jgi:PAS domain S-box-containing protein
MPPLTLDQYERLWRASEIPLALVDSGNRFVRCNRAFCSIVGYAEHELKLRTWQSITHPDDVEGDEASVNELRADDDANGYGLTNRYLTKDGRTVYVRLSVIPVRTADDKLSGFFVSAVPIVPERAERAAKEKFSLLEWASKNKKDALIVALGVGLFLGRDTVIELLRMWLTK